MTPEITQEEIVTLLTNHFGQLTQDAKRVHQNLTIVKTSPKAEDPKTEPTC